MLGQQQRISREEFERFLARPENADRHFELVEGEIVEKMPTEEHGEIIFILAGRFYIYLRTNPIGRVVIEARHRPTDDSPNDRLPDLAFTRSARLLPRVRQGAVPQLPDLCVEVKSPSDRYLAFRAKAAFYLEHGAQVVWLIYPREKLVEVYRSGVDIAVLTVDDTLDGGDLLPGFSLLVRDLFASEG